MPVQKYTNLHQKPDGLSAKDAYVSKLKQKTRGFALAGLG